MILIQNDERVLETSGDLETSDYGVDSEDFPMLFYILRDSLYSDKVTAVLREYSCNAFDANVEAGKASTPIRVSLPNNLLPELRIRDFGAGLDDEQIKNIYVKYCKSTKRNSNQTIGMLGIGAKSGFAYGDSFSVISYQKGTKTSYTAFIDPSTKGKISKMDTSPTDEPDGIEIVIPVKSYECEEFKEKAINLFKYWKVKPEVHGVLDWETQINREEPDFSGSNWTVRRGARVIAVMGNVPYPIDRTAMSDITEKEAYLLSAGIELDFEIGELDFANNREMLQYTDRTKKAIHTYLAVALSEINGEILKKTNNCKSLWEVKQIYRNLFLSGVFSSNLRHLIAATKLTWNGYEISNSYFALPEDFYERNKLLGQVNLNYYYMRRRTLKVEEMHEIEANDMVCIFFNDLPVQRGIKSRIRKYLTDTYARKFYVINYKNVEARDLFVKEMGLEGAPIQLLSSLPIPPKDVNLSSPNIKNSHKIFEYVTSNSLDKKDYWQIVEVDLEEDDGIYVVIDHYNVLWHDRAQKPNILNKIVRILKRLHIDVPKIYAFKTAVLAKNILGDNWVKLETYLNEVVQEASEKLVIAQDIADDEEYNRCDCNIISREYTFWRKLDKNSPFMEFVQAFYRLKAAQYRANRQDETIRDIKELSASYNIATSNATSRYDLKEIKAKMEKLYPMLKLVDNYFSYDYGSKDREAIENFIDYVHSMDKTRA